MKFKLIKSLDVAGLSVFEPVVRLLWGEEPKVQIKKIGLYIVIPLLVFISFLLVWDFMGPRHKTKSGEVPTPKVVLDAYKKIVLFHDQEYAKLDDYNREGEDRVAHLTEVESRLRIVRDVLGQIRIALEDAENQFQEKLAKYLKPYQQVVAEKQKDYQARKAEVEGKLITWGKQLDVNDKEGKKDYIKAVALAKREFEKNEKHLKVLRTELADKKINESPELVTLRLQQTKLEQEEQFLVKRISYLSRANRSLKIEAAETILGDQLANLSNAYGDEGVYGLTLNILNSQERIEKIKKSSYAKPPTFFDQIWTSIKCVFTGFLIATFIAIPLGILCGLSSVFMASMMPLISLFKPVSPIVWLPIVFIIVGGFITNPEEAFISPAFLSTAITVALCSLWPTLVNTALGVASVENDHLNVARMLRLNLWDRLTKIIIPSSLPLIFAGLRISLGVGWMVLIAGELLSSSPGLGKFVWDMFNNGSSETFAQMFVVVFFVGIIGFLLDRLMVIMQKLVSFDEAVSTL